MARFLLSALTAITLVLSAEITKTSALGSQRQPLIQSEQNLQTLLLKESSESGQRPAIREKRVALIIGNGSYAGANPLRNPPNDARAMSAALREIGFDVIERIDLNSREMKRTIIEFGNKLRNNDVGLFYYAGHGVQSNGKNYLIPVDAEIEKEADIGIDGVELDAVLAQIEGAKNRLNIVILDACRNDFSTRGWRSERRGLLQVANAPSGIFIAYATAPGSTASDNKSGQNGLYTQELLKAMRQPGLRIEEVFKQVRLRVKELSNGQQVPWESSSLEGEFYFLPTNSTVASSNHSRPSGGRPDNSPTTLAPNSDTLKNKQNTAVNPDSNLIPPPVKGDRSRDSILRKFDAGLHEDAIREGLEYLDSHPNDAQINLALGVGSIKKGNYQGGFRYISKAVENGMPVTLDIVKTEPGLWWNNIIQGTLKLQKDSLEIQLDKTTTKVPYNLVRDVSAIVAYSTTKVRLKVVVNQNNKIKENTFELFILFFRDYPLTADDVALSGAFRILRDMPIIIRRALDPNYKMPAIDNANSAIIDGWARNVVNLITDIKAKAQ